MVRIVLLVATSSDLFRRLPLLELLLARYRLVTWMGRFRPARADIPTGNTVLVVDLILRRFSLIFVRRLLKTR